MIPLYTKQDITVTLGWQDSTLLKQNDRNMSSGHHLLSTFLILSHIETNDQSQQQKIQ